MDLLTDLRSSLNSSQDGLSLVIFVSNDFCSQSDVILSHLTQPRSCSTIVPSGSPTDTPQVIPITVVNLPLIEGSKPIGKLIDNVKVIEGQSLALFAFRHFSVDIIPHACIVDVETLCDINPNKAPMNFQAEVKEIIGLKRMADGSELISAASYVKSARTAFDNGELVEAARLFSLALSIDASLVDASYNLGVIAHTCGQSLLAVPHFKKVIMSDPSDRTAHSVLGGVIGELEPAAVIRAYQEIVKLQPSNRRAVHRLACLSGGGEEGSDPAYVAEVFDELADTFEDKLVNHLEYRVPWLLLQMLDKHMGSKYPSAWTLSSQESTKNVEKVDQLQKEEDTHVLSTTVSKSADAMISVGSIQDIDSAALFHPSLVPEEWKREWVVVDLGCGSGLCGRLFKKYACHNDPTSSSSSPTEPTTTRATVVSNKDELQIGEPRLDKENRNTMASTPSTDRKGGKMIGVDLSPKMIHICEGEGSYDELYVEDIHETLDRQQDSSVDLILSADTFIYVGDLQRCFELAVRKLKRVGSNDAGGYLSFSVESLDEELAASSQGEIVVTPGTTQVKNGTRSTSSTTASTFSTLLPVSSPDAKDSTVSSFKLRRSGRYGHTERYIDELCEKFKFVIVDKQPIIVRKETGVPIHGFNYLLQLMPASPSCRDITSDSVTAQGNDMITELSSLLGSVTDFIDLVDNKLTNCGLGVAILSNGCREFEMDHICFRCETVAEYKEVCTSLINMGHILLVESMIGGRLISMIQLKQPILHAGFSVSCIEVPSPKAGSPYKSGLEHAEIVVNEHPLLYAKRINDNLERKVFDLDSASSKKTNNPDVSLSFNISPSVDSTSLGRSKDTVKHSEAASHSFQDITVKFHELPIYEVVRREIEEEKNKNKL